MGLLDEIPKALQRLRLKAGLRQEDLRARGGPPKSTVSKLESQTRPPDLATVANFLESIGADLGDLAFELKSDSSGSAIPGRSRPEWVAALLKHGIDARVLVGIAISREAAERPEDLVESARVAAEELARGVLEEVSAAADTLDASDTTDRAPRRPRRNPSPR